MHTIPQFGVWLGPLLWAINLWAQPAVTVEVSSDTVRLGEVVEVTYRIENGQGRLNMPDMAGLPVASGPNSSSSFIYQDGQMRSTQAYSFQLLPTEEGEIVIPATSYADKAVMLDIQAVKIVVTKNHRSAAPSGAQATPAAPATRREKRKF